MAWNFDGTDDYISIADAPALSLPVNAFAMGGWFRKPSNAGTGLGYFHSWGDFAVNPSCSIYLYEASNASFANRLGWSLNNATAFRPTSTAVGTTTGWQHLVFKRNTAGTMAIYRNGTLLDTFSYGTACNVAAAWEVGVNKTRSSYLKGGDLAEWFKVDRDLSSRELGALADGMSPLDLPGIFDATSWYLPMYGGAYAEIKKRLTLTANGSPVAARHPPVTMPFARRQTQRTVATPPTVTFAPGWARTNHLVGGVRA